MSENVQPASADSASVDPSSATIEGARLYAAGCSAMRTCDLAAGIKLLTRAADVYAYPAACAELSFLIQMEVGFRGSAAVSREDKVGDSMSRSVLSDTAASTMSLAAANGTVSSQAVLSDEVQSTESLATRAFDLAMRSHADGSASGSAACARCLRLGVGTDQDPDSAFDLASASNARGSAYGAWQLGLCFYHGTGVPEIEHKREFQLFERAASMSGPDSDGGFIWAMVNLGACYQSGTGCVKSSATACKMYRCAAGLGNGSAMANLGECLARGEGETKNVTKAIEMFEKAISMDNAVAMLRLALLMQKGDADSNLKADPFRSVRLFESASNLGNPQAAFYLGMCYKRGGDAYGCNRDTQKAFAVFQRAARVLRHVGAIFELGLAYWRGDGCTKDAKRATENWVIAAQAGHVSACYYLGCAFRDGIGVRANDAQAVVLLTRAHEQNHLGATFALGLYLLHGTRGLAANPPLGCQYVERACAAGDLDATVLWADIMLHGKHGTKANAPLAVRLLHKSATQSKHVESAYQLAQCYYHGTGTPKSWNAAYQWYSFAFDHGHIGAVHRIACFMRTGEGGVVVNTARALELFKRAADAGHPDAQYDLGMLYYQGIGVAQNLELAVDFMTIASRHGNSNAMVTLGICYAHGEGVPRDAKRALQLFDRAAQAGNAGAMVQLGNLFEGGSSHHMRDKNAAPLITVDRVKAINLYRKAAKLGHAGARICLQRLAPQAQYVEPPSR